MDVLEEIKERLKPVPGLQWGIADLRGQPYGDGYRQAVVLALPYPADMENYDEACFHRVMDEARTLCDACAAQLKDALDAAKVRSEIPKPSQTDEESLLAPFPFKFAAVRAGLGWIGKSSLFITREYGPRVLLRAVLTDADMPSGTPVTQSGCKNCRKCADACPWGFIKGVNWEPSVKREALIDYNACNGKRRETMAELGRKHTCGYCLLACPYGAAPKPVV